MPLRHNTGLGGDPVNWTIDFVSASAAPETTRYRLGEVGKNYGKRRGLSVVATTMRNSGSSTMSHVSCRSRSLRIACLAALAGAFALLAGPGGVAAEQTRSDLCDILQDQLAEQIKAHSGSNRSAKAATMGAKARKLCAEGKQAQGLRAYVKALQLFGVQPIDPK
ncbi:MAG: hypothetical protein ACOZAM_00435 [Pseudomonadota bacterium]